MKTALPLVKSLREFVRDVLLERIARNELVPGQRIVEATLVSEFAISATPVREAIRELVAMEVLEAQNNKGASVREVRLDETIEAFAVRAALEALAARNAAATLQGKCQSLRNVAEGIVKAAKRSDFCKFQEQNQIFHRTIVEAGDNHVLLKTWDSLFFQVRTRFTMDYLRHEDPVAIALEHLPIADALEGGDPDLAASLLASHSNHLVEFLKKEQRQQGAVPAEKPKKRSGFTAAVLTTSITK
jgi:DNA-binding GntR family transcriptional regulator